MMPFGTVMQPVKTRKSLARCPLPWQRPPVSTPLIFKTPRTVPRTGDDSAARGLGRFVWRMTGWHQPVVCAVAILTALLNLIPIELQRRITNEAVETQDIPALFWLGGIYVAVLLVHQAVKFCLNMYQMWLSESAVIYMRGHLFSLYTGTLDAAEQAAGSGRAVSIMGPEVDKLAGFTGEAVSGACANGAMQNVV